jgi:hypothetical protein
MTGPGHTEQGTDGGGRGLALILGGSKTPGPSGMPARKSSDKLSGEGGSATNHFLGSC